MMRAYVLFIVIVCSSVAMGEVVTDNLVLELHGSSPGFYPTDYWQPTVGPPAAAGLLEATGPSGLVPTFDTDVYDCNGVTLPVSCYDFQVTGSARTDGGRVRDLGIEVDSTNPDDFIFLPSKDWTVELWFYPRHEWQSGTEFECLFSTVSSGDGAVGQGITIKRRMQDNYQVGVVQGFLAGENGNSGRYYYLGGTSLGSLQLNEWNQIVLVFTKDTGSGDTTHSWYHNGEFDRTFGEARNLEYPLVEEEFMTPPNQLSIAARFDGTEDEVFNGEMAVVRVYSAALAPEEVAANYAAGIGLVGDVTESEGFTEVQEEGETSDTFDVGLTAQPSSDVTVDLVYDANQVSLDPTSLLFTSGWDPNTAEPETVTVTAIDGTFSNHYTTIQLKPTSDDWLFDGKPMPSVTVRVIDNDSGMVTVEPTAQEVMEEGPTSDSFTVSLSMSPIADDVVINFSDYDPNQISLSDDSIIFTTANWDIPQTLTVTAIDDNIYEPLIHSTTITSSVAAGSDIAYEGQPVDNVSVDISDNECGASRYAVTDLNQDCVVDIADFATMADEWLVCTFPTVEGCIEPQFEVVPSDISNEGILFVDHESAGRSGLGGQAITEAKNGDIIAFYSNVSATDDMDGHGSNGWAEYKISEDGGQTWSEPYILDYSMSVFEGTEYWSALVEEVVTAPNGTIVAIADRHYEQDTMGLGWPRATAVYLRSYDNGKTWSEAKELNPSAQEDDQFRIRSSLVHNNTVFVLNDCYVPPEFRTPSHTNRHELYVSTDNGESFSKRSVLPFTLAQFYGTISLLDDGHLIAYSYNSEDDGQVLQYTISEDEGYTWTDVKTTPFAKRIRNPQLSRKIGGLYFMHGRSGHTGDDPKHLVLYTSRDGISWDSGVFLNKGEDDLDSYSTNAVVGRFDPLRSKRLLIQAAIAYPCDVRIISRKVNIHHWWIDATRFAVIH